MVPFGEEYPGITYSVTEHDWMEKTALQETLL